MEATTVETKFIPKSEEGRSPPKGPSLDASQALKRNGELRNTQRQFYKDPSLAELRDAKSRLPINRYRDQILQMISTNVCSIVTGAAGGGRTTPVLQTILEDGWLPGSTQCQRTEGWGQHYVLHYRFATGKISRRTG